LKYLYFVYALENRSLTSSIKLLSFLKISWTSFPVLGLEVGLFNSLVVISAKSSGLLILIYFGPLTALVILIM
jgi:hypothetical protein